MFGVPEEIRINVRTSKETKRDLAITARLRGLTVSSLVNALIVKAIREEKLIEPQAFKRSSVGTLAGNLKLPKHNAAKEKPDKRTYK